ncbi:MAG TPA: patatin-like phospholipase family protein [Bryobacteraceae bacterium]|nr:patatin-like phospholipase family protein [Bryobacteraceae bacterium]
MEPKKIGLALSGGGFRATLFHLGVVRFLYDAGLLSHVHRITSVSGGSVLAAHLGLNWDRYTGKPEEFDSAAKEVIKFTMADVRGRILRRWILAWITLLPRTFWRKHWRLTQMLKRSYDRLFQGESAKPAILKALPSSPEINILCTSMTTGSLCTFDRLGFCFSDASGDHRIECPTLHVSYAVAASSAFPPLFPPVLIDNRVLMCDQAEFQNPQYLTDGGVFDNLGLNKLLSLQAEEDGVDILIVSDAEGNFDWALNRPYKSMFSRNVRASDMLMTRVSKLQYEMLGTNSHSVQRVHIGIPISQDEDASAPDPGTQRSLRNIRTDLDAFSPKEVAALIHYGHRVACRVLSEGGITEKTPAYDWPAIGRIASSVQQWEDKDKRQSQARKARLWSNSDWVSWASAAIVLVLALAGSVPVVMEHFRLKSARQQIHKQVQQIVELKPTAAVECAGDVTNSRECHTNYPAGCSPTGIHDGFLNTLKNQRPARDSKPVRSFTGLADFQDLESHTPKTLVSDNHSTHKEDLAKLGEAQEYGVIGYLYYANRQGAESTNCMLTGPDDTDFHIGIGFDKNVAAAATPNGAPTATMKATSIIVEMTPHYRAEFAPGWTLDALKAVLGKQVRVVGQLMADNEHNVPRDDCGLPDHGSTCSRASIWELHPVTSFQWCNAADCNKDPSGWVELGSTPK